MVKYSVAIGQFCLANEKLENGKLGKELIFFCFYLPFFGINGNETIIYVHLMYKLFVWFSESIFFWGGGYSRMLSGLMCCVDYF